MTQVPGQDGYRGICPVRLHIRTFRETQSRQYAGAFRGDGSWPEDQAGKSCRAQEY